MTPLKLILTLLFIFLISYMAFAQNIKVHDAIGKKQSDVIKTFGTPVHQDNSNPSMKCIFYKGANYTLTFVCDKEGVYQAEASAFYPGEAKARAVIDDLISSCCKEEYMVDTVSVEDFHLSKTGVKVDLQVAENKLTKKYDVRVKAVRTGG